MRPVLVGKQALPIKRKMADDGLRDWGKEMMNGHVVEAAVHCVASASTVAESEDCAEEIDRLRAELAMSDARVNALTWVLRVVRREVNWGPDSPTLRLIEQSIASGNFPRPVERAAAEGSLLRSV
jgi:hypothetical protein